MHKCRTCVISWLGTHRARAPHPPGLEVPPARLRRGQAEVMEQGHRRRGQRVGVRRLLGQHLRLLALARRPLARLEAVQEEEEARGHREQLLQLHRRQRADTDLRLPYPRGPSSRLQLASTSWSRSRARSRLRSAQRARSKRRLAKRALASHSRPRTSRCKTSSFSCSLTI